MIAKDFTPIDEAFVGGQDETRPLIAAYHEPKKLASSRVIVDILPRLKPMGFPCTAIDAPIGEHCMLSYEKCRPSRGQPDFAPDGNSLAKFKSIEGVFLRPVRYRRIPDRNMIHPPLSAFSQRLKIVGFLALILVKTEQVARTFVNFARSLGKK